MNVSRQEDKGEQGVGPRDGDDVNHRQGQRL